MLTQYSPPHLSLFHTLAHKLQTSPHYITVKAQSQDHKDRWSKVAKSHFNKLFYLRLFHFSSRRLSSAQPRNVLEQPIDTLLLKTNNKKGFL